MVVDFLTGDDAMGGDVAMGGDGAMGGDVEITCSAELLAHPASKPITNANSIKRKLYRVIPIIVYPQSLASGRSRIEDYQQIFSERNSLSRPYNLRDKANKLTSKLVTNGRF